MPTICSNRSSACTSKKSIAAVVSAWPRYSGSSNAIAAKSGQSPLPGTARHSISHWPLPMVSYMMSRSVMLVEDNIDDQFLTKRTLRKAGINSISVAGDGQEALNILLTSGEPLPELLILDLRLPKIHGLKV